MRIQLTAVLAALSVGCILGAEKTQVDIYINSHDDSVLLLGAGTVVASGIYEKIGVHLNWRSGAPKAAIPGRTVYFIRTLAHAPESVTGGAVASSELFASGGTEITIYKDRMARFLDNNRSLSSVGAGYVLAHELAHLMQGVPRHSDSGILKAHWNTDEYKEMFFHNLAFTQADVELIHQGLDRTPATVALVNQPER
jgi:hypothetical protein